MIIGSSKSSIDHIWMWKWRQNLGTGWHWKIYPLVPKNYNPNRKTVATLAEDIINIIFIMSFWFPIIQTANFRVPIYHLWISLHTPLLIKQYIAIPIPWCGFRSLQKLCYFLKNLLFFFFFIRRYEDQMGPQILKL